MALLDRIFPRRAARRRACAMAESQAAKVLPDDPVQGSVVCADEGDRIVVRVFCGFRKGPPAKAPPWSRCLVFAVAQPEETVVLIVEDERYQPTLR